MHAQRAIRGWLATAMLSCVFVAVHAGRSQAQWTQTNGPRGGTIRSLLTVPDGAGGTRLYTGQIRVWRTEDNGESWAHLSNGLTDANAFALLAVPNGSGGNDILVGTGNGIFRSADNGASWSASSNGVPANLSIYSLASGPNGSGGNQPVCRYVPGQRLPLDRQRRRLDRDQLRAAPRPGQRERADDHGCGDGPRRNHERHLSVDELRRQLDTRLQLLRILLRQERHHALRRDQQRRLPLDQRRGQLDRDQHRHGFHLGLRDGRHPQRAGRGALRQRRRGAPLHGQRRDLDRGQQRPDEPQRMGAHDGAERGGRDGPLRRDRGGDLPDLEQRRELDRRVLHLLQRPGARGHAQRRGAGRD